MELTDYRESQLERLRTEDLVRLALSTLEGEPRGNKAIDIGARDGFFSKLLSPHFESITALDLETPSIPGVNINCVQGDITKLNFNSDSFDFVLCSEVLEHIPPDLLEQACLELSRIARKHVLIGVPFNQDTRLGRTSCQSCGKINPPWGHVNSFSSKKLVNLFPSLKASQISYVGTNIGRTNFASAFLMDLAGNPYGTYDQEEACIHCGKPVGPPSERTLMQRILTKSSFIIMHFQSLFTKQQPNWIHILFEK